MNNYNDYNGDDSYDSYDSYYDDKRDDFEGVEGEKFKKIYYSYSNSTLKYVILVLVVLNFIIAMVFERIIIPAFTNIWNMTKLNKLRRRKIVEDENNFTMQELFQLNEKET